MNAKQRNARSHADLSILLSPREAMDDASLKMRGMLFNDAIDQVDGAHVEPLTIVALEPAMQGWKFCYPNRPMQKLVTYTNTEPRTWQFFTKVFNVMEPGWCYNFLGYSNGRDSNILPLVLIQRYAPTESHKHISARWAGLVKDCEGDYTRYLETCAIENAKLLNSLETA